MKIIIEINDPDNSIYEKHGDRGWYHLIRVSMDRKLPANTEMDIIIEPTSCNRKYSVGNSCLIRTCRKSLKHEGDCGQ